MPRGYYDPELSKKDPLKTIHIKIPTSVSATLGSAAARKQRPASFLIRKILSEWAFKYRDSDVEVEEDFSAPKRRKA